MQLISIIVLSCQLAATPLGNTILMSTNLSLTAHQKQRIRTLHDDSFQAYCATCGYEPDEHAELLLGMAKAKFEYILDGIDIKDIPTNLGSRLISAIVKMRAATDFFEFRNVEHEERRQYICAAITRLVPRLPIAYDYAARLCKDIGLVQPSLAKPASIAQLIESVPIISNWDFEFNAFVTGASLIDEIPCICVYETLLSTCAAFLHCIVPFVLDFKEKAKLADIKDAEAMGKQPDFINELHDCITMAMGKTNFVKQGAVETEKNTYSTVHVMVEASVQFVWYHEFGHLLQGHLAQPQSNQLEFDADSFAFRIIAHEPKDQSLDIWFALGSLMPLVIIDILETVSQLHEAQSHPAAKLRIERGVHAFKTDNPRAVRPALGYLRSLAAVCNPTLKSHWGVSLDYEYLTVDS